MEFCMQVSLTLISSNDKEARSLSGILDLVTGGLQPELAQAVEAKALPSGKAKAKEEKVAKKKPAAPIEEDDDDDLGIPQVGVAADDDEEDDLDFGDEEEEDEIVPEPPKKRGRPPVAAKEPEAPAGIGLSDMIEAFKGYAKKHSRDKAADLLSKYGVTSVRALKQKDYAAVLKVLVK